MGTVNLTNSSSLLNLISTSNLIPTIPVCRRAESLLPGWCEVRSAPVGDVSGVPGLPARHVELLLQLSCLLQRQRTVQGRSLQGLSVLLWRIFRWVCCYYSHLCSTYKRQREHCQQQYNIIICSIIIEYSPGVFIWYHPVLGSIKAAEIHISCQFLEICLNSCMEISVGKDFISSVQFTFWDTLTLMSTQEITYLWWSDFLSLFDLTFPSFFIYRHVQTYLFG